MAGSYGHCEDDDTGSFRFDLIENMGDAHEACFDMYHIIRILTKGDRAAIKAAEDVMYAWQRGETGLPEGCVKPYQGDRENG